MAKKKTTEEAIISDLVEATKPEVKEVAPEKKANCCCARCKAPATAVLNK